MPRRPSGGAADSVFAEVRAGEDSQTTAVSAVWGQRSRSSPLCWDASSSPSKQSCCPSPSASLCTHTPLLQWKPLFLQPGNHTRLSQGNRKGQKVMSSCPLYFDSTSRRCGPRSRPHRRRSGSETRACRSHSGNGRRPLEGDQVRGRAALSRRRRGAAVSHRWFPGTRCNRTPTQLCGCRCGCCRRSHIQPANSRNPGNGR